MSEWISVEDRIPDAEPGKWSLPVIALCDNGRVFDLMCMNGYWQRSTAFVDSGATEVTHWMVLELPDGW